MINVQMHRLEECLNRPLPGQTAQLIMAPSIRPSGMQGFDGSNPRSSGVMILLFPGNEGLSTVFILRTDGGPHGGQISFPGGKQERADPDLTYTALRETHEEVGVNPKDIRVIGKLTPLYVPHSNYMILPVVGYVETLPDFVLDKKEVAGVIISPLASLFHPGTKKTMIFNRAGLEITAPYYDVSGHRVWGATAMIMSEFEGIFTSCTS